MRVVAYINNLFSIITEIKLLLQRLTNYIHTSLNKKIHMTVYDVITLNY